MKSDFDRKIYKPGLFVFEKLTALPTLPSNWKKKILQKLQLAQCKDFINFLSPEFDMK